MPIIPSDNVPTKSLLIEAQHIGYHKGHQCYLAAYKAVKKGANPLTALKQFCPTLEQPELFVETIKRHPEYYRLRGLFANATPKPQKTHKSATGGATQPKSAEQHL